jgi:hypothetical protein
MAMHPKVTIKPNRLTALPMLNRSFIVAFPGKREKTAGSVTNEG